MALTTVTIDMPEEVLTALDQAVREQHRDRGSLLTDAIDQYLSLDAYHREQIEEGIRQADAGDVVDHEVVVAQFESWKAKVGLS